MQPPLSTATLLQRWRLLLGPTLAGPWLSLVTQWEVRPSARQTLPFEQCPFLSQPALAVGIVVTAITGHSVGSRLPFARQTLPFRQCYFLSQPALCHRYGGDGYRHGGNGCKQRCLSWSIPLT